MSSQDKIVGAYGMRCVHSLESPISLYLLQMELRLLVQIQISDC